MSVLVSAPQADWYVRELRASLPSLELVAAEPLEAGEAHFADTEVLVCGSELTRDVVERMPNLRWVQSYISGVEQIVASLAARDDVLLTSARGVHGPQMAEMALLHMLYLSRNVRELTLNQQRHDWRKIPPRVLEKRVVGIVGVGAVGSAIALACSALDMVVLGFSRTERDVAGFDRVHTRSRLLESAPSLDFLVLSVPYSAETDKLVDAELLAAMKPTAILVNLSRGGVVDEAALVEALRDRRLGGAGLDVVEHEPLGPESPLWDIDSVFITPHLAGQSDRYHEQLLPLLEHNLRAYVDGELEAMLNVITR